MAYDKFVACLMKNGNRSAAEAAARGCVALIKVKEEKESLNSLARVARKATPLICGSSSTKGRKTKIVPIPSNRGRRLAIQ